MAQPLLSKKKVVKRTKKFARHQSDRFKRLDASWRRPRGIDSAVRRRFHGRPNIVSIGFGTEAKMRHVLPNGFKKFRVQNVRELELLLMHNRTYAAEIASGVSVRNRKAIIERAAQLNVKVLNASARVRTEESE